MDDLERRLRHTLEQYQDVIFQMTVDISETRQCFVQSLVNKINEVDSMLTSYEAPPSLIQLVAIDVDRKAVYDILQDLQFQQHENVGSVFEQALQGHSWESILGDTTNEDDDDDDDNTIAPELGFITKTHVTLAHYRDMSQSNLRSIFTPYIESTVELVTNAIYYNERIMALAILNNHNSTSEIITNDGTILPPVWTQSTSSSSSTSSLGKQPQALNREFLHITIWCNKGVSASEAKTLPSLVKDGKAHRIEFPEQVLQGSISFWCM